ncbi:MAG: hypothetical protein AAF938_19860 [Myxococcota bacterium]
MPRRRRILMGLSAAATASHLPNWASALDGPARTRVPAGTRARFSLVERNDDGFVLELFARVQRAATLTVGEFVLTNARARFGSEWREVSTLNIASLRFVASRLPRRAPQLALGEGEEGSLGTFSVQAAAGANAFDAHLEIAGRRVRVPSLELTAAA